MQIDFPGFFDLQVNGFAGVDFNAPCTPEQLQSATNAMRAGGVTQFLPTIITSSREHFASCARAIVNFAGTAIAGIHLEGPYISPQDGARGAHPLAHVCEASIDDFKYRQDAADGRIVLVTLAPEVPHALMLIEYLVAQNIKVAIGHTAATPPQIQDGIHAGATLSTHLGNGCANLLPRHPNFIWEQLAADELHASFIVDGHHLPAATVKAMMRAKTLAKTILVTDAIAAAGCAPGSFELGGVTVELAANGRVAEPGKPWLAGSSLAMHNAVANTVRFTGLSVEEILPLASTQPANYLGLAPLGTIIADWDEANYVLTVQTISD
jgi:N-acetylglucosamine-6-phosphate deacetylase